MDTRFHCVYLLVSLDPLFEHKYYIGYTVNPVRRLRQHNGELVNGASFTRRNGRPWKLVCCVSGFTEDRVALKFEWCWQNPHVSSRLKHTAPFLLRGLHGLPFAVGILHLLLHSHLFAHLELTLHLFDANRFYAAAAIAQAHKPRIQKTTRYKHSAYTNSINSHFHSCSNCSNNSKIGEPTTNSAAVERDECVSLTQPLCSAAPLSECTTHLPELKATSLLHIESITLPEFENKYLSLHSDSWLEELDEKCDMLSCCNTQRTGTSSLSQPSCSELEEYQQDEEQSESLIYNEGFDINAETSCSQSMALRDNEEVKKNISNSFMVQPTATDTFYNGNNNNNNKIHLEEVQYENKQLLISSPTVNNPFCTNYNETEGASRSRSESPPITPTLSHTVEHSVINNNKNTTTVTTSNHVYSQNNTLLNFENNSNTNRVKIPLRFHHMNKDDLRQMHRRDVQLAQQHKLTCTLCTLPLTHPFIVRCTYYPFCALKCHLMCLAMWFHVYGTSMSITNTSNMSKSSISSMNISHTSCNINNIQKVNNIEETESKDHFMLVPLNKVCACPLCHVPLHWAALIRGLKRRARESEYEEVQRRRCMMEQRWAERLRWMQRTGKQKNKQNAAGSALRKGRRVCQKKAITENNNYFYHQSRLQEGELEYAQTQMEIVAQHDYNNISNNILSSDALDSISNIICDTRNNNNDNSDVVVKWNEGNNAKRARSASPTVLVRESRLLAPDMYNTDSTNNDIETISINEYNNNNYSVTEWSKTKNQHQELHNVVDAANAAASAASAKALGSKISTSGQSQPDLSSTPIILGLTEFNEEE